MNAALAHGGFGRFGGWLFAIALGTCLVVWMFPLSFVFPAAPASIPALGDGAQHIVGQRYFIRDAWRWPLLAVETVNTPDGLNIAFVDAIPGVALLLKPLSALLPDGFHGIGLWYAISALLQPVAAVWALRGTGETRIWPSIAVALIAAGMPAWLGRFGHAALMGHFLILLGLGIYLRLMRDPRRIGLWVLASGLQMAALLVHPYLAVMTLALLAAVPVSLLLRFNSAWFVASCGVAAALSGVLGLMALLGYFGATGDVGYGRYALNLLSPVWPAGSWLMGAAAPQTVDATGYGGWEGYNFLGFGVLGGLTILVLFRPRTLLAVARRHGGLIAVLAALTAIALSHRVGFGEHIVLDLGSVPRGFEQFRASGRFFWPVGYTLAIGAVAIITTGFPRRLGAIVLLLLGAVQFADAAVLLRGIHNTVRQQTNWAVDAAALRPLLAGHQRLTLLPSWFCVSSSVSGTVEAEHRRLLDVLYLASETALPASTMYVARWHRRPRCTDTARAAAPLGAGELRLLLPSAQPGLLALVPAADAHCRPVGELVACSNPSAINPDPIPELTNASYDFRAGGNGVPFLAAGFSHAEAWGTWTEERRATILAQRTTDLAAPVRLELSLVGYGPRRGAPQGVEVRLGGRRVARWELPDGEAVTRRLELPTAPAQAIIHLEFVVDIPTSPADRDGTNDNRELGFAIVSLDVIRD